MNFLDAKIDPEDVSSTVMNKSGGEKVCEDSREIRRRNQRGN